MFKAGFIFKLILNILINYSNTNHKIIYYEKNLITLSIPVLVLLFIFNYDETSTESIVLINEKFIELPKAIEAWQVIDIKSIDIQNQIQTFKAKEFQSIINQISPNN